MRSLTLSVSCLVALIVGGCGSESLPAPGQIVFAGRAGTVNWQLYVTEADGSGLHRITFNEAGEGEPSWSPDGTQIAFNRDEQLCVIDAAGRSSRCLTPAAWSIGSPAWSPDGTRIAFSRQMPDADREIYVVGVDGSNLRRLTTVPGDDDQPSWSPDGGEIAFSSDRRDPGSEYDIYVMNTDGSDPKRLTGSEFDLEFFPQWSPDGKHIAFERRGYTLGEVAGGNAADYGDIYVMNPDGGDTVNLGSTATEAEPDWSPDGKQIIFTCGDVGADEVCTMNADGTDRQVLTHSAPEEANEASGPAWAPHNDGRR